MNKLPLFFLLFCMLAVPACKDFDAIVETEDALATARADHKQGMEYDMARQMRLAELYYKKSYESFADPSTDWLCYADAGYRYAYLMMDRGATDDAMMVLTDILGKAEGEDAFPEGKKVALLALLGFLQLDLGLTEDARASYATAYRTQKAIQERDGERFNLFILDCNIFLANLDSEEYDEAHKWLQICEEEFRKYKKNGDADLIAEYEGQLALYRVLYLQAVGRNSEAASIYDAIPSSRIYDIPYNIEYATSYLMNAGRYAEAAEAFERLDKIFPPDYDTKSLDYIDSYIIPRYLAKRKAGKTAEALLIADDVAAVLDSAIIRQKHNSAAELAVIYQTHQREMALQEARGETRNHRLLLLAFLVIIITISGMLYRTHSYNKDLLSKNRSLYQQILQREKAEAEKREMLSSTSAGNPTQTQLLYQRICKLMEEDEIFTDPSANHETLARILGTNVTYIYDALRECAGITPADFINQHRLRYAANLLTCSEEPVGLIIEMSGITNRSTFNRLFREYYSMSPTEYRQAARTV
ncbi:MAG: helix-turn-helix domain-containing protein [Bacteroidales bacterium]|nr:helix-turn-helix domain-containing protein [Bacteroidales bacterium]